MSDDLKGLFEAIGRTLGRRRGVRRVHRRPAVVSRLLRSRRRAVIGALAVAALAASGAAAVSTHRDPGALTATTASPSPSATASSAAPGASAAELQAAQWVATNVGPTHVVACDVAMCAVLSGAGVQSTSMVTAGSDISGVEAGDVVVTTAVSRRILGAALTEITSPEPLAVFGSGGNVVEVRTVTLTGSEDYARRLMQDRGDRERVGSGLARNPRITLANPGDTGKLTGGMVDSRLCSLLALLSSSRKITVASFDAPTPGAGADIPISTMVISTVDGVSATGDSPQARTLLALLASQQAPYRPAAAVAETAGLRITFAQPEPLGLITGSTP